MSRGVILGSCNLPTKLPTLSSSSLKMRLNSMASTGLVAETSGNTEVHVPETLEGIMALQNQLQNIVRHKLDVARSQHGRNVRLFQHQETPPYSHLHPLADQTHNIRAFVAQRQACESLRSVPPIFSSASSKPSSPVLPSQVCTVENLIVPMSKSVRKR